MREAVILATVLRNPSMAETFLSQLEQLLPSSPDHGAILNAIVTHAGAGEALVDVVEEKVGRGPLDRLYAHPHVQIAPPVRRPDAEVAEVCLTEELAKLKARRGYQAELSDGIVDLVEAGDENVTWRLYQAAEARNRATKAEAEDRTEFDIADNGAELKRDERNAFRSLVERLTGGGGGS